MGPIKKGTPPLKPTELIGHDAEEDERNQHEWVR